MYYSLINSMNKTVAPSYTARTSAFATATGITDTTILGALNTFDLGLISNSLDTKMKALYPFIGTTSTTQKYNFMDARDLDIAFRLQFNGGGTFSSNGYQPGGVNGYANTNLNPSANISLDSVHLSYYSRTSTTGNQSEIGCYNPPSNVGTFLSYNYAGGNYKGLNSLSTNVGSAFTPSTGFLLASRINSTTEKYYFKGTLTDTLSKTSQSLISSNLFIGAHNIFGVGALNFSSKEVAFASIGSGLTDGEATTFYNLVQNMQTTLARQI